MSLNKVMLIGNVGGDPEIRYMEGQTTPQGNAVRVANFRLATSERFRGRDGQTRERTEWHSIVAWRNLAELADKYIRKGTQLYVEGRLQTREWDDKTGAKRYSVEIVAETIQLLGRRGDAPVQDGASAAPAPAVPHPSSAPAPRTADDIPAGFSPAAAPAGPEPTDDLPF